MFKNIKFILILVTIIVVIIAGTILAVQFSSKAKTESVNVKMDATVIVQKIQKVSKLETIESVFQRDLDIELDLGSLEIFGAKILDNKRTQKFAITGSVVAGVDLSKLKAENIKIDSQNRKITIDLPSTELFSADINGDKLRVLRDEITLLYRLESINENRKNELNETLTSQLITQSKKSMVDAACKDKLLDQANENAKESIKNLFALTDFTDIVVNVASPSSCGIVGL